MKRTPAMGNTFKKIATVLPAILVDKCALSICAVSFDALGCL
jgi:hypothetical protein